MLGRKILVVSTFVAVGAFQQGDRVRDSHWSIEA